MSLKTGAKRGTVVLISTILITSMALSGLSGALVTTPDTHSSVTDSSTDAANNAGVSIEQTHGASNGNGSTFTRYPGIRADTSLTFDNGTKYHFRVTNEDTGESMTVAINESVEIPAFQPISFFGLYNIDGSPSDHPSISSLGSLSTTLFSGSLSADPGPTNFSVALLNASTGDVIARTETKPALIAYSGVVTQNSTTGTIRLSAPKDVLAGNVSVEVELYREGGRFEAPRHSVEMEYEPATDEYVGLINASAFAGGTYDWTLYLRIDGWEAKAVLSAFLPEHNVTIGPPPIADEYGTPTDTDDDGVLEDVNGDGEFGIVDVQVLFVHRDSAVVQNNAERFDFSGDGQFSIADIQQLFVEFTES